MIQSFHDPDLTKQFLKTSRIQLGLVNDLDCHFLAGWNVFGQFDLCKIAFANSLQESIFPDVRLLARPPS